MGNPVTLAVGLALFFHAAALADAAVAPSPYTAEYKFETIISQADGTTKKQESTEVLAVDGQGRSMHAKITAAGSGFDVSDPAAHKDTEWSSLLKQATVHSSDGDLMHCALAGILRDAIRKQLAAQKPTVEDLGTRSIAGVEAHGTRTTYADPFARADPKQSPLVTVDEKWSAIDAKLGGLVVRETSDISPRHSGWTKELTRLKRGDPDPKLFAPPSGYKIINEKAACALTDG